MIIEIPDDNSIVKWKKNDKDEWKSAEISDLINAYEEKDKPLPDFKAGYKQAILDGKANYSRPQGKWIFKPTWDGIHKSRTCDKCGYHEVVFPNEADNFCPNCGADMRGVI